MSEITRPIKLFAAKKTGTLLAQMLPRLAAMGKLKWGLTTLSSIAKTIPSAPYQKVQLEQLREAFANEKSALQLAERLSNQVAPKVIANILNNLWMPIWEKADTRAEFIQREGFAPPLLAVISPSKECNLQCKGCYANAVTSQQDQLDFDTLDRIITELRSFGTYFIVISGGEPTHPKVWPMLKEVCAKHREQAFMIYTNGTLLDDQKVQDILDLGNISPAISVEGWKEHTDGRRGDGVFDKLSSAMDRLREAKAFFGFSLTYTRDNFDAATDPALIDFLIEKGCMYGWYFMYVPVGKDPDLDLLVTPSQRNSIRQFTWDVLHSKGLFIADFWNSGPMSKGCIAGGRYLHIDNKGNIEPCVFFKFTTHNIHESRIIDALRSPLFGHIREGQKHQRNPLTPCQFMDHPSHALRAVSASGATPSEEGGDCLFGPDIMPNLEQWSAEYREKYATPAWAGSDQYMWSEHAYKAPEWTPPGSDLADEEEGSVASVRTEE